MLSPICFESGCPSRCCSPLCPDQARSRKAKEKGEERAEFGVHVGRASKRKGKEEEELYREKKRRGGVRKREREKDGIGEVLVVREEGRKEREAAATRSLWP